MGLRVGVVEISKTWVGTPYRHQMSLKGVGCDCLGLVRGVWRELGGSEIAVPAYSPDWAEVGGREVLLEGLGRVLRPVPLAEAEAGDVLAFRMKAGAVAKHVAVLTGDFADPGAKIVHAYWGHAVVESWLRPFWGRQAVAAFRFEG